MTDCAPSTGAASGAGAATARVLAREGASVLVADVNGPGAEAVAKEIEAAGGSAVAAVADVAEEAQIAAMVGTAVSFLASDRAAFIIGRTVPVDGGLSAHTPSYADERQFFGSFRRRRWDTLNS